MILNLHLEPEKERSSLIVYLVIAFLISFLGRLLLLIELSQVDYLWQANGAPVPILNPDSGLYAYYAQEILAGHFFPLTQKDMLPAYLFAGMSYLLSVHLDWIIFLGPPLIASLTVIPIILIGKAIKQTQLGFFAAILCTLDVNFYARSGLGYFDTDILNLFFPLMIIYFMIRLSQAQKLHYALFGAMFMWLFGLWYHSAAPINAILLINFFVISLVYYRKSVLQFQAFFLFATAIAPLPQFLAPLITVLLFMLFNFINRQYNQKSTYYIFTILLISLSVLMTQNLSRYYQRAYDYLYNSAPTMNTLQTATGTYYYYNQMKTVGEAAPKNLLKPDGSFSQQTVIGLLATNGYILMVLAYPALLYTLPLLLLGYASYFLGGRFMMYASPELSLGLVYLMFILFQSWRKHSTLKLSFNLFRWMIMLFFIFFAVQYILAFNKRNNFILNFSANDIEGLRELSTMLSPKDTIVTWWDFGWPMWYYAGTSNTLSDNGRHGGIDSYAISKIYLSNSPVFVKNASCFFSKAWQESHRLSEPYFLSYLAQTHDLVDTFKSLEESNTATSCPEGDVYIFTNGLTLSLLEYIFYTSNFDLRTGKVNRSDERKLMYDQLPVPFNINGSFYQGNHYDFNNTNGYIYLHGEKLLPVHKIWISKKHHLGQTKTYDNNSTLNMVVTKGKYIVYMDDKFLNSFIVQAYFFDQYDKTRFTKVIEVENMKIFKVLK